MSRLRSQAGFTVIEILIALLLAGVTSAAVITTLNRSGKASVNASLVAKQNAQLRTAMNTIQRNLAYADRPLLFADWANEANKSRSTLQERAPWGGQIDYVRTEDLSDGTVAYYAERIKLWRVCPSGVTTACDASVPDNLRNTVTLQSARITASSLDDARGQYTTTIAAAAPKVLLDKALAPNDTRPLFHYRASAAAFVDTLADNPATAAVDPSIPRDLKDRYDDRGTADPADDVLEASGWINDVALIDVTLARDEDATEVPLSAGHTNSGAVYRPATLSTSVYLQRSPRTGGTDALLC